MLSRSTPQLSRAVISLKTSSLLDTCPTQIKRSWKSYNQVKTKTWDAMTAKYSLCKRPKPNFMGLQGTSLPSFTNKSSTQLNPTSTHPVCTVGSQCTSLSRTLLLCLRDRKLGSRSGAIILNQRSGMSGQWVFSRDRSSSAEPMCTTQTVKDSTLDFDLKYKTE